MRKERLFTFYAARILTLPLIWSLYCGPAARAAIRPTLALLPLSELSRDYTGIDLATTSQLEHLLTEKGFQLITQDQVFAAMAAGRIYDGGWLNRFNARKISRRLQCDLILTGTITETAPPGEADRFGLLLNIFSGRSGRQVGSLVLNTARPEEIALLGIGEPRSQQELKERLLQRLGTRLAEFIGSRPLTLSPPAATTTQDKPYEITEFNITPNFVPGGIPITISVHLDTLGRPPDKVVVCGRSRQEQKLTPTPRKGIYHGFWQTSLEEGEHPLSLRLVWLDDKGRRNFHENDLGRYRVCHHPPVLELELRQGVEHSGTTYFNQGLLMLTHYPHDLPLSGWQLEIVNL